MAVLQAGQRFGAFALERLLARGGMGEVWRARKSGAAGWEKTVALKLILPMLDDERFAKLFHGEARIAAALDHPNVVPVFGFGQEAGLWFLEMEYVAGQDLRHILERVAGPLPLPLGLFVVGEMLKGLAYAHERRGEGGKPLGLVHRDVKPHNVLVSYEGSVKLSDFGIAKVHAETRTSQSEVKGTAGYIAPEVLDGQPATPQADLFAVGLVLWETLTGGKLFDGATEAERLRRTFECRVPALADVGVSAPAAVESLVRGLLARDPGARPASAAEALAALLAAPGGRAATSVELRAFMQKMFAAEAAQALAATPARVKGASADSGGAGGSAGDGVPREIHDGPVMGVPRAAKPGLTPTLAGEQSAGREALAGGARGAGRRAWLLGGLVVAAGASVAAVLALGPDQGDGGGAPAAPPVTAGMAAPGPADAAVVAPSGPGAPPEVAKTSLVIEVVPPDAQVSIDGAAVAGESPFVVDGLARGGVLKVRIARDGYATDERAVIADAPVVRVAVTLAPAAPEKPRGGKRPSDPTGGATWRRVENPPDPEDRAPPPEVTPVKPPPKKRPPGDEDGTMVPVEP